MTVRRSKKITFLLASAAIAAAFSLGGCSLEELIENDANIGKNKPAVGTVAQTQAAETEAAEDTAAQTEMTESPESENALLASEILGKMSADEKIGQLLLARIPASSEEAVSEMYALQLGGYTMYADDFKSRDPGSVRSLTDDIKAAAAVTPFIAVDEEGGSVVRVSKYTQYRSEPFSSPQLLYKRGGTELLQIDAAEKADLLSGLGINLNLAPVADITDDENAYIYPRTLGQNAADTAAGIAAIVSTSNEKNLASCLKHFPGYGANTDTHTGSAHDGRALYELRSADFIPFEAGITADEDKTPAVMINHNIYDSIDPDNPASLSEKLHGILREDLSFDGVIMTDDMGMDAVAEYSGENSPYVTGILAGNDMLCVTDYKTALSDLKAAYESGEITDDILDEHVTRILVMKIRYGIADGIKQPELPNDDTEEASADTETAE
ncbi:MAG: glycoside hydrolase family 3 N-terminal domain-containing protein [Huintestinicola sp.]